MAPFSTCHTLSPMSRLLISKPSVSLNILPGTQKLTSTTTSTFPRRSVNFFRPRVSFPIIKASIDVGSNAIRPVVAVETDKLPSDARKRAMEAVDAFGGRVTIGDVSSKAGLNLNQAQKALQALASDTNGFLEVSDEGDVLYVFPKDYHAKLAVKSFRIKFEPWVVKAKAAVGYLVRVSFGTLLIASIIIVLTAIIVLIIAYITSKSDEDKGRQKGKSFDTFNFKLIDWFCRRIPVTSASSQCAEPQRERRQQLQTDDDEKMNFIESVFSFVFGDGDPNQGIEEERWKLIGRYISSNGGVVTAEELAPYLDLPTTNAVMSDESYVLPVLLSFDGQPEIDAEGNILYRFPSLQRTASSQRSGRKEYAGRSTDRVGGIKKFFKEKKWQLSKTSSFDKAGVIGLGGINLFGVIILGAMLKDAAVTKSAFIKFVMGIFPLLQIYAGSFFAVPLVRWLIIYKRNSDIEKRNQLREQFARALESPDISLRQKLHSARDMAQKTVIGPDRIVYSTDRDLVEQVQDLEGKEWDRRFLEIEKS